MGEQERSPKLQRAQSLQNIPEDTQFCRALLLSRAASIRPQPLQGAKTISFRGLGGGWSDTGRIQNLHDFLLKLHLLFMGPEKIYRPRAAFCQSVLSLLRPRRHRP